MPDQKDEIYGEWFIGVPPLRPTHADRILGVRISHDPAGRPEWVDLQWNGDGVTHQMQMDFPNAMFLLSLLKSLQLDSGVPFPDDPRGKR